MANLRAHFNKITGFREFKVFQVLWVIIAIQAAARQMYDDSEYEL